MAEGRISGVLSTVAACLAVLAAGAAGGDFWAQHHPRAEAAGSTSTTRDTPRAPGRAPGAPIASPVAAMLAPAPDFPGRTLPVRAPDGTTPASAYAATVPRVLDGQARIGLVVAGLGLDHAASLAAIRDLPASVGLAFSPYAHDLDPLLAAAREAGHETFASIPMEPEGSPQNDEGDMQLAPGDDLATNVRRLEWSLGAFGGYVGAIGAEGGQTGGHVAGDDALRDTVIDLVAARGLLYIDPVANDPTRDGAPEAVADTMLEPEHGPGPITDALRGADALAAVRGHALLVTGLPGPASLAAIVAWTRTLPGQGIVLVPASSLATVHHAAAPPPPDQTASAAP